MQSTSPVPVAFTFFTDGKEWHGGRNYFQSLFLALQRLPNCGVQPVAFIGSKTDTASFHFPANVKVVKDTVFDLGSLKWNLNRIMNRLTGKPRLMNRAIMRHGIQITSHGSPSRDTRVRVAAWIPDFQHVHLPQFFKPSERESRTRLYRKFLADCDLVIVSSESAKLDLNGFAPEHAHKARVLRFCAVQPDLIQSADIDVRREYSLPDRYFYIPNQFWAHKNHIVAIRALALIAKEHPHVKIVCSGTLTDYRNPEHLPSLKAEINRLGLYDRFILLGVVPYTHIARLMLSAVAVINPSLFEGWSTPVEEAKAIGVPLILSGIPVHREQCQQGEAVFFDRSDPAALANQLRATLGGSLARQITVEEALDLHRERSMEFARTYEVIVQDLRERL